MKSKELTLPLRSWEGHGAEQHSLRRRGFAANSSHCTAQLKNHDGPQQSLQDPLHGPLHLLRPKEKERPQLQEQAVRT